MKINIVNLTPHDIVVVNKEKEVLHTFPPEGCARLKTSTELWKCIGKLPITKTVFGEVKGLPEYDKYDCCG